MDKEKNFSTGLSEIEIAHNKYIKCEPIYIADHLYGAWIYDGNQKKVLTKKTFESLYGYDLPYPKKETDIDMELTELERQAKALEKQFKKEERELAQQRAYARSIERKRKKQFKGTDKEEGIIPYEEKISEYVIEMTVTGFERGCWEDPDVPTRSRFYEGERGSRNKLSPGANKIEMERVDPSKKNIEPDLTLKKVTSDNKVIKENKIVPSNKESVARSIGIKYSKKVMEVNGKRKKGRRESLTVKEIKEILTAEEISEIGSIDGSEELLSQKELMQKLYKKKFKNKEKVQDFSNKTPSEIDKSKGEEIGKIVNSISAKFYSVLEHIHKETKVKRYYLERKEIEPFLTKEELDVIGLWKGRTKNNEILTERCITKRLYRMVYEWHPNFRKDINKAGRG